MIRDLVVRTVKPLLSDQAWRQVRRLDPTSARRDRARAARAKRPSLTQLAKDFRTDKWGPHRYTPIYESHLKALRDKEFTLLEIGIGGYDRNRQGGASLRMWKAFFPRAQIVGLDIEDKSFVDEDRITTVKGSQVDFALLDDVVSLYQPLVVIDDGSHENEHVLETFQHLFPKIPDDGLYMIEDTQTSYWGKFGGSTDPHATTSMNFVKDLVDGLNYEEYTEAGYEPTYTELHVTGVHAYHNLVVIEKGSNDELGGKRHWLSPTSAAREKAERLAGSTES